MRARNLLSLPYLAGVLLLVGLPALAASVLAFTEYSAVASPTFNGLDNFDRLLGDEALRRAVWNTLIFMAMSVPLRLLAITVLSLVLYERFFGASIARAGVYLPTVVPDVAYALMWLWVLNPIYGPLAALLGGVGLDSPPWLTDPWAARFGVVLMGVFQIGEGFVIALAARRALPTSVFEAARVDGASPGFILRKITLPLMAPVLGLLVVRDVILSLQISFVPALLLTDGGPRYATTFVPGFIYREAFRFFRFGYASAIAVVLFLVTAAAVFVQYRMAKRWKLI